MTAPVVPFLEAVQDVSAGNTKIPQSEFLANGQLAVVDQGQALIAGYTNNLDAAVATDPPVIVFGDHTRALKWVDFPFAMGADGVKVLRVREGFDPSYIFRYLQSRPIPSAGYSRHYKFLKEFLVPKPPLPEQRRVAAILDHADALCAKRRQVLVHLDNLTQTVFRNMFEGRGEATVPLGDLAAWQSGGTPSRREAKYFTGDIPWFSSGELGGQFVTDSGEHVSAEAIAHTSVKCIAPGSILVGMYDTAALKSSITCRKATCNQAVAFAKIEESIADTVFVYWAIQGVRKRVLTLRRGIRQKNLNLSMVREIQIPRVPLALQRDFTDKAALVAAQRTAALRASVTTDDLLTSLQSRALRGEL